MEQAKKKSFQSMSSIQSFNSEAESSLNPFSTYV